MDGDKITQFAENFLTNAREMAEGGTLVEVHYEEDSEVDIKGFRTPAPPTQHPYEYIYVCTVRAPKRVIDEMKKRI